MHVHLFVSRRNGVAKVFGPGRVTGLNPTLLLGRNLFC